MRRTSWLVVAFVLAFVLLAPLARAEGRVVTLHEAIRAGADAGPGVRVAEAPAASLDASRTASRSFLTSTPTLTAAIGPRLGNTTTLDVQVGAYVPFSVRNVSGARGRVVDATSTLVRADVERARNDAALRAATAWTRALESRELLAVRRATLARVDAVVELAEKRAKSGVALPSEVVLARGDRAAVLASVLDAEGLSTEALVELRVSLGLPAGAALEVTGDLAVEDPRIHGSALVWAKEMTSVNATLKTAAARERLASAEVSLAHATTGTQVSVGAMFAREGDGSSILLGSLSVPLPFVDPAAFERARARGAALTAGALTSRARADLEAMLSLALHEMDHTRELRATLEHDAFPALREAERLAEAQFAAGTSDIGPVLLARQRRLGVEESLTRARAEVWRADLRFAHVTGHLVPEGS
jgi:outer membrane protein TolC